MPGKPTETEGWGALLWEDDRARLRVHTAFSVPTLPALA